MSRDMVFRHGFVKRHFRNIGTFGINVSYLDYFARGNQVYQTAYDYCVAATFGRLVTDNLGLGFGLRYIYSYFDFSNNDDNKAAAKDFSFDLAMLYKVSGIPGLCLGLNLSNMGPKISYVEAGQDDPIPTNLRAGFAYDIIKTQTQTLKITGDLNKMMVNRHADGSADRFYQALFTTPWVYTERERINIGGEDEKNVDEKKLFNGILSTGLEYVCNDIISWRCGYYWDRPGKLAYWTYGVGVNYYPFKCDISYIDCEYKYKYYFAGTTRLSVAAYLEPQGDTFQWRPVPFTVLVSPHAGLWIPLRDRTFKTYRLTPQFGIDVALKIRHYLALDFGIQHSIFDFYTNEFWPSTLYNDPDVMNTGSRTDIKTGVKIFFPARKTADIYAGAGLIFTATSKDHEVSSDGWYTVTFPIPDYKNGYAFCIGTLVHLNAHLVLDIRNNLQWFIRDGNNHVWGGPQIGLGYIF